MTAPPQVFVRNLFYDRLIRYEHDGPGAPYQWPSRQTAEEWVAAQVNSERFVIEER